MCVRESVRVMLTTMMRVKNTYTYINVYRLIEVCKISVQLLLSPMLALLLLLLVAARIITK